MLANTEMHQRLEVLRDYMDRSGLLGYAVARNIRKLSEAAAEYLAEYYSALKDYGECVCKDTYKPPSSGDNYRKFIGALEPIAFIEHEVEIFKVPFKVVMEELTAEQMLELNWMLKDEEEEEVTEDDR